MYVKFMCGIIGGVDYFLMFVVVVNSNRDIVQGGIVVYFYCGEKVVYIYMNDFMYCLFFNIGKVYSDFRV